MATYRQGVAQPATPEVAPTGAVRDDTGTKDLSAGPGTYVTLKTDASGNLRTNIDSSVALAQIAAALQAQQPSAAFDYGAASLYDCNLNLSTLWS